MKLRKILLNNLGLKLLAALLAFVTWFYIEETTNVDSERTVLQRLMSPTDYLAKKLIIKPILVGKVPEGYILKEQEIKVTPESIIVIGPPKLLIEQDHVYTKQVDLSEYTKSKTLTVELRSISRSVKFEKTDVQIFLPIETVQAQAPPVTKQE